MDKTQIIAHSLVKNEERFIYYSLKSALPFVDKIMVWDTGSTDKTVEIIKSIKSEKIEFQQKDSVDPQTFTKMRNQMLDKTPSKYTWLMLLDGDEIWPHDSLKKVSDFARENPEIESIVLRTHNLVGDIYHRLPESAGNYSLAERKEHLNLRFMNLKTIPGLNVSRPHGQQGYFDKNETLVQDRNPDKIKFFDLHYHHATHLQRSSSRVEDKKVIKRSSKYKYELGEKMPDQDIPQVFFENKPPQVPDVTQKAPASFWFIAALLTPLRRLKRLLLPAARGY